MIYIKIKYYKNNNKKYKQNILFSNKYKSIYIGIIKRK